MKKALVILFLLVVVFAVVINSFGRLSDSIWTPTPMAVGPRAVLSLTPGTFRGTGTGGFYGDIIVDVTVDNTGILDIEIVYERETPAFGAMVYPRLIPLMIAINSTGVNVVTGATMTSRALINAVEDAMLQAGADLASLRAGAAADAADAAGDAAVVAAAAALGPFNPGTFTGVGFGYYDEVHVAVTFDASRITAIEVVFENETPMFAMMAFSALIPEVLQAQTYDVDIVSGATYTSEGFLDAIHDAVGQARQ